MKKRLKLQENLRLPQNKISVPAKKVKQIGTPKELNFKERFLNDIGKRRGSSRGRNFVFDNIMPPQARTTTASKNNSQRSNSQTTTQSNAAALLLATVNSEFESLSHSELRALLIQQKKEISALRKRSLHFARMLEVVLKRLSSDQLVGGKSLNALVEEQLTDLELHNNEHLSEEERRLISKLWNFIVKGYLEKDKASLDSIAGTSQGTPPLLMHQQNIFSPVAAFHTASVKSTSSLQDTHAVHLVPSATRNTGPTSVAQPVQFATTSGKISPPFQNVTLRIKGKKHFPSTAIIFRDTTRRTESNGGSNGGGSTTQRSSRSPQMRTPSGASPQTERARI